MPTDMSTSQFVPTRLGRLHVRSVGSGPPAVLWHSMFVDSSSWDRVVPSLAEHRRLYLVDAPSHGKSDPLDRAYDIAACAGAAEDLLAGLGMSSVDWLGNAWGGHVGIHLAAGRPDLVRSLIAISAPTNPISPSLRRKVHFLLALYRMLGARGPVGSGIAKSLLTDHTRRNDPAGLALLMDPLRVADRTAMVRAVQTAILNRTDLSEYARRITALVLFIATDDRGEWTPEEARSMTAQMRNASELTVTKSRVIPAIDQPSQLISELVKFWSRADQ